MKKFILSLAILSAVGCKKNTTTPPSTNTNNPPPAVTMTSTETALMGKWIYKRIENRDANGQVIATTNYTDPNLYVRFLNSHSLCATTTNKYDMKDTTVSPYINGCWRANGDTFINGTPAKIILITTDSLIIHGNYSSNQALRHYYHK